MAVLKIFAAFFRVGALTLGGGLAMISVLRYEMIAKRGWISEEDFSREFATATALPGAIVLNFSLLSGYRMRGAWGAAAAFLGAVLPSFLAIIIVAVFLFPYFDRPAVAAFLRGASASVAGLLAYTAFTMCRPMITRVPHLIAALAAAGIALVPGLNPIYALIIITIAVFCFSVGRRRKGLPDSGGDISNASNINDIGGNNISGINDASNINNINNVNNDNDVNGVNNINKTGGINDTGSINNISNINDIDDINSINKVNDIGKTNEINDMGDINNVNNIDGTNKAGSINNIPNINDINNIGDIKDTNDSSDGGDEQ